MPDGWQRRSPAARRSTSSLPTAAASCGSTRPTSRRSDAKKAWEQQEKSTSKQLPNYQRISIESVDYNGWDAADWEFTFGNSTHVLNRGFVPNPDHGYAIYLSSREENWSANQEVFQAAADTFMPAQ